MKKNKGILKVRVGYNPNSSSIGTHVSYFVKGLAVFTVITNIVLALIKGRKAK